MPQFYLNRFAIDGEIEVVELWGDRKHKVIGVPAVAVENHFYTLDAEGSEG